jgi:hypothetical protein
MTFDEFYEKLNKKYPDIYTAKMKDLFWIFYQEGRMDGVIKYSEDLEKAVKVWKNERAEVEKVALKKM